MEKIIKYDSEARAGLQEGVDILAKAVKSTLGARGRNVFIADLHGGKAQITKDGVTVAKAVELGNGLPAEGIKLMKQVALNTNEEVGDGTTTSIVLAQALVNGGMDYLGKEINPIALKKGIDKAVDAVCAALKLKAKPVEGNIEFIKQIATISANNDETIGELIAQAFEKVGKHGVIRVEEATNSVSSITHMEGFSFDRGYINHFFADPLKEKTILREPYIIITDRIINTMSDFGVDEEQQVPLLNALSESDRPVIIICDDMETALLQEFTIRKVKGHFNSMIIKSPEFGERRTDILKDIAAITGGVFISKEQGMKLSELTIDDLGSCALVEVDENNTSLIGGHGKKEDALVRVEEIKERLKHEKEEFAKEKLEERLAKLTGGVAILKVGAKSEVEMKEVKDRVEDALNATRAAIEEGVVAGGGIALFRLKYSVDVEGEAQEMGADLLASILEAPLKTIIENSGEDYEAIKAKILNNPDVNFGYNVKEETYGDMFKEGIIDPVKVTRVALQNAASIAGTLLTTSCTIHNKEVDDSRAVSPQFS